MRYEKLYSRKNDLCFAILLGGVFVVTVAGAVAGYLDLAGGRAGADSAKVHEARIALRGSEAAHAGAVR